MSVRGQEPKLGAGTLKLKLVLGLSEAPRDS